MNEVIGDFWNLSFNYEVLCVTTNCVVKKNGRLVMGGGIAKQFLDRFPQLDLILGQRVRDTGEAPVLCVAKSSQYVNRAILALPTKRHWRFNSTLDLIAQSALATVELLNASPYTSVLSVRPGCGLGGLKWGQVKPVLEASGWDERFFIVSPKED